VPPLAPYGFHVVYRQPTSVVVQWDTVPGAIGYRVLDAYTGHEVTRTGPQANQVALGNLRPSSPYAVQLQALGPDGPSALTPPLRFSTT